ncbi:MAG: restriction endonuclease subunit S [Microbacteriaceae bacterium]|nr:restriction endonuclease subunit S [Microbacteriaceae bacterium]
MQDLTRNLDKYRRPVTKSLRDKGKYPYFGANGIQDWVADYIFDGDFLLIGEDGSVINSDRTPVLNWASGKVWINNHAHVLEAIEDKCHLRFLFHYLKTVDISQFVTGGTQPKLNQKNLNSIPVPLLPLEEQKRFANILDKFDALVSDISVGLPAELAARRKQYEFYREKLLSFEGSF